MESETEKIIQSGIDLQIKNELESEIENEKTFKEPEQNTLTTREVSRENNGGSKYPKLDQRLKKIKSMEDVPTRDTIYSITKFLKKKNSEDISKKNHQKDDIETPKTNGQEIEKKLSRQDSSSERRRRVYFFGLLNSLNEFNSLNKHMKPILGEKYERFYHTDANASPHSEEMIKQREWILSVLKDKTEIQSEDEKPKTICLWISRNSKEWFEWCESLRKECCSILKEKKTDIRLLGFFPNQKNISHFEEFDFCIWKNAIQKEKEKQTIKARRIFDYAMVKCSILQKALGHEQTNDEKEEKNHCNSNDKHFFFKKECLELLFNDFFFQN